MTDFKEEERGEKMEYTMGITYTSNEPSAGYNPYVPSHSSQESETTLQATHSSCTMDRDYYSVLGTCRYSLRRRYARRASRAQPRTQLHNHQGKLRTSSATG